MSRPFRIAVENGWYHVLNRGIDGRQLFPDDRANEHFLELLESMPERFGLRIHEASRQRGNGAVGLAYYLGQRHAGMTLRELGKYMGEVEYPAVSVAIARFQNRLKTERSLQRRVKQVEKLLKVEI